MSPAGRSYLFFLYTVWDISPYGAVIKNPGDSTVMPFKIKN